MGAISNPPKSDDKYFERSVELVRGWSFRKALLQNSYFRTNTNFWLVLFQKFEEALKLKKEAKKKQKGSGGGTDESNSGTPQVSTRYLVPIYSRNPLIIFVAIWVETMTPKIHSEIKWPLAIFELNFTRFFLHT